MTELHWMSVAELNRAYAQKKLSPVEVTKAALIMMTRSYFS